MFVRIKIYLGLTLLLTSCAGMVIGLGKGPQYEYDLCGGSRSNKNMDLLKKHKVSVNNGKPKKKCELKGQRYCRYENLKYHKGDIEKSLMVSSIPLNSNYIALVNPRYSQKGFKGPTLTSYNIEYYKCP